MAKDLRARVSAILMGAILSASADAALIYSNGFDEASDLANWEPESASLSSDGEAAISNGSPTLAPQQGEGYLVFTGNSSSVSDPWYGGIFLDITNLLIPGLEYQLSYYWGGSGEVSSTNPILEVGVTTGDFGTGNVIEDRFFTNTQVGVWTRRVVNFIALDVQGDPTYLDLAEVSSNSQSVDPAIDNLTITRISSVPAPGTLALMLLGLIGTGLRWRQVSLGSGV